MTRDDYDEGEGGSVEGGVGDDFDDFEEGEEDAEFGDFDNGFQGTESVHQSIHSYASFVSSNTLITRALII